jgi:hypothetical protein
MVKVIKVIDMSLDNQRITTNAGARRRSAAALALPIPELGRPCHSGASCSTQTVVLRPKGPTHLSNDHC